MIKLFFLAGNAKMYIRIPFEVLLSPSHQKQQQKNRSSPLKTIHFECPLVKSVHKRSQQFVI